VGIKTEEINIATVKKEPKVFRIEEQQDQKNIKTELIKYGREKLIQFLTNTFYLIRLKKE
jgi:hypothetical protein